MATAISVTIVAIAWAVARQNVNGMQGLSGPRSVERELAVRAIANSRDHPRLELL